MNPNLFMTGDFTLRSGAVSKWKIECDALTCDDWKGLAAMVVNLIPPFRLAHGVPRGGLPFAYALNTYATGRAEHPILIAEDVCTTGGSMERYVEQEHGIPVDRIRVGVNVIGVCVFARNPTWPKWVTPIFCFSPNEIIRRSVDNALFAERHKSDPSEVSR